MLMWVWLIVIAVLAGAGAIYWREFRGDGGFEIGHLWDRLRDRVRGRRKRSRGGWQWTTGAPPAPVRPAPASAAASSPSPPPVRVTAVPAADLADDEVHPAELAVITGTVVPADWAAVNGRIAGYEPENDAALLEFMEREAAAFIAHGEAWRALVETLLQEVGLDPVAIMGASEFADTVSENAQGVTLARRRFLVTYAAIREAVANGLQLPFRAREFLTGEGG